MCLGGFDCGSRKDSSAQIFSSQLEKEPERLVKPCQRECHRKEAAGQARAQQAELDGAVRDDILVTVGFGTWCLTVRPYSLLPPFRN